MHELKTGEADVFASLRPDSLIGAAVYLLLFVLAALLLARALRAAMSSVLLRYGHMDRTTMSFLQQIGTAAIWVIMLILYAHLIPVLRAMGTALLAGVSIASVVIGLAAQNTLGNLIAGVSITLYRPFRLGDTLQVSSPTGTEVGTVELISLGYTTLRTADGRRVVLPNSVASSQVTINLGAASPCAPLPIVIGIGRDTDVETARRVALASARDLLGEAGVLGCFLTRVDPNGAALELRVQVRDPGERDALRSQLVAALARRFTDSGLDAREGSRASFS
jgi:small-conductance mechanosensitive channel